MLAGTLVGYFCAACAALTIHGSVLQLAGFPVGAYVDDTTPAQCEVVAAERVLGVPLVIAGQAPGSHLSCPGAIMAKEWYPSGCSYRSLRHPPRARAYILQWRFAWPGCRRPSLRRRVHLLGLVERKHPLFVFWF
jgi:hypothetical protein